MYASLYQLIQSHVDKAAVDLPADVRSRVDSEFFPHSWEGLTPSQRLSLAQQYDIQRDPAMAEENRYWFDLWGAISEAEGKIMEWEGMHHQGIPSEARIRDEKLIELRKLLAMLEEQSNRPFAPKEDRSQVDQGRLGAVEGSTIDSSIVEILRDAARRLLWPVPALGKKWESDEYAAAFITDDMRATWRACAQRRDEQEIYFECENLVSDVWRRSVPQEAIPQAYAAGSSTGDVAKSTPVHGAASLPPPAADVAPWLRQDPRDRELTSFDPWGTPARYFARQFVKEEPILLSKRVSLAVKVRAALNAVNIKKRGGVHSLDSVTIKKAFIKLDFS